MPRPSHAQILVGIDGSIANANFVVKMRPSAASRRSNIPNHIASMYVLSSRDGKSREMPVARAHAVAMFQQNRSSIAAHEVCGRDHSVRRSHYRLTRFRRNIHARVERAFSIERINALTERAGHL